jgi:hypothetical protein
MLERSTSHPSSFPSPYIMVLPIQQILDEARAYPHYLGNANVSTHSVWIPASDGQSEVLVPTTDGEAPTGDTEPTVLCVFAQIRGGSSRVLALMAIVSALNQ